jgi:alpha-L-fucosidase
MKINKQFSIFFKERFGMFVHWGIYSIPAVHEQYWQRCNVPAEEYIKLADEFNPTKFDPVQWLDLAQEAGMEYLCFTTKHHDGYCMWDTKLTEFNIMNSPYGKDILGMLAEECHKRDFPLELYYSVVDWYHPAYPNIGRHHEIVTDPAQHDMAAYVDFLKAQITELCTNYGRIHGIWWDMNVPEYKDPSVHQLIRELQPHALINNRGFGRGDFATPERDFDPEDTNVHSGVDYQMTEACQSVGVNSWGYRKDEDYFSSAYFTEHIDSWLAKGSNYLLNVGPDANGVIPTQAADILKNIGQWFKPVRESFNGTPENILSDDRLLTLRDGNTIYVHCPAGLGSSTLSLAPLTKKPEEVILMNNGCSLPCTLEPTVYNRHSKEQCLRIRNIPVDKLNGPAIIKLC